MEEVEVDVEKREGGQTEVEVKVVEVLEEVDEEEKTEDVKSVPSIGPPEKLKSNFRPTVAGVRPSVSPQQEPKRATPSRAAPPAAIRRHVTVRPRPWRPVAGPSLPSPRPGSPPNPRWQALARRQQSAEP